MKPIIATAILLSLVPALLAAAPESVSPVLTVHKSQGMNMGGRIDVVAKRASLIAVARELEPFLGRPVSIVSTRYQTVAYQKKAVFPIEALKAVAESARLRVIDRRTDYLLTDRAEPLVTLDVKDVDVLEILKQLKVQCGIRNMLIDKDVAGKGTFLLRDLPCQQAFEIVFSSLGLSGKTFANSVVSVQGVR